MADMRAILPNEAELTFDELPDNRLCATLTTPSEGSCAHVLTPGCVSVSKISGIFVASTVIGTRWPSSMAESHPRVEVSKLSNGQYMLTTMLAPVVSCRDAITVMGGLLYLCSVVKESGSLTSAMMIDELDARLQEMIGFARKLQKVIRETEGTKVDNDEIGEIERVYRLIEAADKRRDEVVLCLLGTPGIGKTESVERFARDHGRDVVHIIASQIMPNEVSGMTMPNQATHSMEIFDHEKLGHLKDGDIIFFDELLKGQQQVLNACLTLIQERRLMSGKRLPDVLIIAAANPLGSAKQLPLEIRQRFLFVNVDWDAEEWSRYMRESHGITPTKELVESLQRVYSMCRKGDSSTWNTLTPRTATKLMLWVDAVHDDYDLMMSVSEEIGDAFGIEVKNSVVQSVMDKYDVTKRFLSGINEILKEVDTDSATLRERVDNIRDNGLNKDTMQELVDSLMALDEWPRISEMLKSIKLDELDLQ